MDKNIDKMRNDSISKSLDELADEEIMRQIPLMIYLIILCISGIVGNILVCYIYTKKYTLSTFRIFITVLATVDLFISSVIIPFELLQFAWQYTYTSVEVCKLTLFVKTWATITSGSLLFCIAFDRYRKVCKPFGWQVLSRTAKTMCVGSAFVGVAVAWISPVIYSIRTKELDVYNITISECAITEPMKKSVLPLIHNAASSILFVGALTGIIIMYILIAIRVKQQLKWKIGASRRNGVKIKAYSSSTDSAKHNVSDDNKSGDTSETDAPEISNSNFSNPGYRRQMAEFEMKNVKGYTKYEKTDAVKVFENDIINIDCHSDMKSSKTTKDAVDEYGNRQQANGVETVCRGPDNERTDNGNLNTNEITAIGNSIAAPDELDLETVEKKPRDTCKTESTMRKRCLKMSGNKRKTYKTTLIMFIVSLAFIVSYLPLLSLLLIGYADKTFVSTLTDSERTAYKFFFRSYLLNCAVNPVIYGIWDVRFKTLCKAVLSCRKI